MTNRRRFFMFLISFSYQHQFFYIFNFFHLLMSIFFVLYFFYQLNYLGHYRRKLPQALKQLEAEFWPNGLDKPPVLDRTHPWLVYECPDGSYEVINGNHRKILFERNATASSTWPCRVIPKEEVFLCFFMCWQT